MAEPQYVALTLAWCNRLRKKQGKKPLKKLPKGERYEAESCPCGRATGLFVEKRAAYESESAWRDTFDKPVARTPESVRRFIADFDGGLLPQYEAKS